MTWDAVWFIDGEVSEESSFIDQSWEGGESGNWWVCTYDDEAALSDGLYEVVLSVEGEVQASDAIFVGGEHPPVEFVLENSSVSDICLAYLSPPGAQNWGEDELGDDFVLSPAQAVPLEVPAAMHDVLLVDCDGNTLLEEYEVNATANITYTVSDS